MIYLLGVIPILMVAAVIILIIRKKNAKIYKRLDLYDDYVQARWKQGHGRWNANEYSPEHFKDKEMPESHKN